MLVMSVLKDVKARRNHGWAGPRRLSVSVCIDLRGNRNIFQYGHFRNS